MYTTTTRTVLRKSLDKLSLWGHLTRLSLSEESLSTLQPIKPMRSKNLLGVSRNVFVFQDDELLVTPLTRN